MFNIAPLHPARQAPPTAKTRSRQVLRIIVFAVLSISLFYISINTGLALIYAYFLTHPGCIESPQPIANVPPAEEHWLPTTDELQIRAWYYPPKNGVVIITSGGQQGALGQNPPPVAGLIRSGFGVLQMDSRACARPRSVVTLGADEIYDIEAGVDFLANRSNVERIGAFGFSMGGAAVIGATAINPKIEAVIAEGGFFNLGDDIVEPDQEKSLSLNLFVNTLAGSYWLFSGVDPWQVSPIDDLPRISPRPVFLIYGQNEMASGRAAAQFSAAKQPKSLWIVPRGSHGTNHMIDPAEYEQEVTDFFTQSLLK